MKNDTEIDIPYDIALAWVVQRDGKYRKMLRQSVMAVTRRDKRRSVKYDFKQAIDAIDETFHRYYGFNPYNGSVLDPELLGEHTNNEAKPQGVDYR